MIRLAISVEGPTEERFIKKVIAPYLQSRGVAAQPILLGRARNSGAGGGNVTTERLISEMKELTYKYDAVTSLVDFYGFKGKQENSAEKLGDLIRRGIEKKVGQQKYKAAPYVQRHEFESLLFSDVSAFSSILPDISPRIARALSDIRSNFDTPEDINDNQSTAPSKRIENTIPGYRKSLDGPEIAEQIGLEKIRAECPRFNAWLEYLETLQENIEG